MIESQEAATIRDFIAEVNRLSLASVYFSLAKLRDDLHRMDSVIAEFQECKREMTSHHTGFTANMLNTAFKLTQNLGSCQGLPTRIMHFYAEEVEAHVGKCPQDVLRRMHDDFLALSSEEFKGISGERWAMNLLAPDKHTDTKGMSEAEKKEFLLHVVSKLEGMKHAYRDHSVPLWFIEGLRKAANRGKFGFLNYPSFFKVASTTSGLLAWSSLGWLAVKLWERDGAEVKLFGTGSEEWFFHEMANRLTPHFINDLATLRSAIDAQIKRAEGLQSQLLALFLSASIAGAHLLAHFATKVLFHVDMDMG